MDTFDKHIITTLVESIEDLSANKPDLFYFANGRPFLREGIRVQILKDIDSIRNIIPVSSFYIVGDSLLKGSKPEADIIVDVYVDAEAINDISTAELFHYLKTINNKLASDTLHKIVYVISVGNSINSNYVAMYDVLNDRWSKWENNYGSIVDKWLNKLDISLASIDYKTGKIQNDVIYMQDFKTADVPSLKRYYRLLKERLEQLDELLLKLSRESDIGISKLKYDKYLNLKAIVYFTTKFNIPESLIHKLFEKYYYIKFLVKLENLIEGRTSTHESY